jgi:hypothetical protein
VSPLFPLFDDREFVIATCTDCTMQRRMAATCPPWGLDAGFVPREGPRDAAASRRHETASE